MTQKKLYVIILSFFTIIIGVVCFSLGNYFDTNSLATEKLKTQISALEENTSSLTDTKNDFAVPQFVSRVQMTFDLIR